MADKDLDNQQQVRNQFGPAAADYATSDIHARGESLELLVQWAGPRPDWNVLDVATGAGHTALAFAPHVSHVVAGDLTEAMLDKTRELAGQRGLKNIDVCLADAGQLPFADASFDAVTCRLAMHHFPNPGQALVEMRRVLKPRGVLAITDNVTVEDSDAADYYNRYERLRDPSHCEVFSMSELQSQVSAAGFDIRQSTVLGKEFEFHAWADRQRVPDAGKQRLRDMMEKIPTALTPLFQPRFETHTFHFSLWEAVLVADWRQAASTGGGVKS